MGDGRGWGETGAGRKKKREPGRGQRKNSGDVPSNGFLKKSKYYDTAKTTLTGLRCDKELDTIEPLWLR
jgi:hypothetical protein